MSKSRFIKAKDEVEEKTYNLWCANGDTCTLPLGKFWSEASGRVTYNAKELKGKYCRIKNNKVKKNHTWEFGEGGLTCKKTVKKPPLVKKTVKKPPPVKKPVKKPPLVKKTVWKPPPVKKPVKKPPPVKKPVKKPPDVKKPVKKPPDVKKPVGKKPAKKSSGFSIFRRWYRFLNIKGGSHTTSKSSTTNKSFGKFKSVRLEQPTIVLNER
jgi:hypothetical protein